jgi:hypothetical protein
MRIWSEKIRNGYPAWIFWLWKNIATVVKRYVVGP